MNISRRMVPAFAGAVVSLVLALSASALAAPVTVKLRVEGSTKTLFEGEVTTQAETFETTSSNGPHPCNYAENGRSETELEDENGGNMSGTPTTALRDAALANGLAFNAEWYGSGAENNENPGDFFVTQVGSDVNETSSPYDSWGYAVDDTTAPVGGCQIALSPGSEVLWAYNYFNLKHLLSLSGPSSVTVGAPFTVHVTDGQTGEPISGAAIGQLVSGVTNTSSSSPTTNASGNATVTLSQTGSVTLKATQAESVRSNGLAVNVVPASACACGGPAPVAPPVAPVADVTKVMGVKNGHVYSRRSAPRLLAGVVEVPSGGTLRQVRISLQRRYRGRCFDFSGSRERFVRAKKCGSLTFFSVGGSESFSYLLPASLPKGSYVYDIEAIDSAGQPTKLVSGVSHVVFQVK
jgi:hypothetical protein